MIVHIFTMTVHLSLSLFPPLSSPPSLPPSSSPFQCPYRHSEVARSAVVTWVDRNCLDVHCPYRHPGGREKKGSDDLDAG